MSSGQILPDGVHVGAGYDEAEAGVVTLEAKQGGLRMALVLTPRQGRALGALIIKQSDLVEAAERARRPILGLAAG